jgi:hypothetical protein
MNCATHLEVQARTACTRCSKPLCDACTDAVEGKSYCTACGDHLRSRLAQRSAAGSHVDSAADHGPGTGAAQAPPADAPAPIGPTSGGIGRGSVFALAGGVVGALLWFGSVVLTNYKIGFAAVGVGLIVGYAAFLGNGKQPSTQLAIVSVVVAVAAIFAGEYLIVSHIVSKEGASDLMSFDLFMRVYKETLSPIDVLFYAIGAFEAYKLPAAGKPA